MKREELLEKKMVVGDLDGDSVVEFLKKHGIEYYNIKECKTNWISINKSGEVAYYLRENGYNECAYPEIDLGNIIYQDIINSPLVINTVGQPKPIENEDETIVIELHIGDDDNCKSYLFNIKLGR